SANPAPVDSEPAPGDSDPAQVDTDPAPADTDPEPADTEPAPVDTHPATVDSDPVPVGAKAAPVEPAPAPVDADLAPAVTDSTIGPLTVFPMLQSTSFVKEYNMTDQLLGIINRDLGSIKPNILEMTKNIFNPPPICAVCENATPLDNLFVFLQHVASADHIAKIRLDGGYISFNNCMFWIDIMQHGETKRTAI
ncbi:hypothetical protein PFISCL1PPCAC_27212, partial [Pristionchus fissidentatus]